MKRVINVMILTILLMLEAGVAPVVAFEGTIGEMNVAVGDGNETELDDGEAVDVSRDTGIVVEKHLTANEVNGEFYFASLNFARSGSSMFSLTSPKRHNMMLAEIRLATYKYEEYTLGEVDSRIEELIGETLPDWVDHDISYTYDVKYDATTLWPMWLESGSRSFLRNAPGMMYYAVRIQDLDEETEKWIIGKFDYREAAYSAENYPHVSLNCTAHLSADGSRYEYERTEPLDGEYMVWGEEFGEMLDERLMDLEAEIRAWDHGLDAKQRYVERLEKIWHLAEDTVSTQKERDWVERLLGMLEEKEDEVARADEELRREEERRQEEERKRQEEEEQLKREEEEKRKQEEEEKIRQEEERRRQEEEAKKQEEEERQQNDSNNGNGGMGGGYGGGGLSGGNGGVDNDSGDINSAGGLDNNDVMMQPDEVGEGSTANTVTSEPSMVENDDSSDLAGIVANAGLNAGGTKRDNADVVMGSDNIIGALSEMGGDTSIDEEKEVVKVDHGTVEVPVLSEVDGVLVERKGFWWWIILVGLVVVAGVGVARKIWREKRVR